MRVNWKNNRKSYAYIAISLFWHFSLLYPARISFANNLLRMILHANNFLRVILHANNLVCLTLHSFFLKNYELKRRTMKLGAKENRFYVWGAGLFCLILLMLLTPTVPQSQDYHIFADRRNFFGVPNTLNVISIFPFLIIGVIGFVLCLHGNYFGLSLRGEVWGWLVFYAGVEATAFGSAYYHLKPDDARLVLDRLPVTIAFISIMVIFIIERIDERTGTASLFPLLTLGIASTAYWRLFDDLRPYVLVQFIPFIAIPAMSILLPPKYTHSVYWLWSAGFFLLAEIAEATDKKLYKLTHYIISGHTLKHLSAAMVPILLTIMLSRRSIKIERDS